MSQADDPFKNLDEMMAPGPDFSPGAAETDSHALGVPPVGPPPAEDTALAKPPKPTLRERLRQVDIFTVMLGLSLLALIIAVVVLAIELSRYKWDTSARSARQSVMGNRPTAVETFRLA
ncbi:hypothetical protein [Thermogutta sp.]|uniref:hypothetical protein n=1 Tax=Thermogutta sp. TaxID=1962930 RepID=UPI0032206EDB